MSRNHKSVERSIYYFKSLLNLIVAADIRANTEEMENVDFKGYSRIPTKILTISTRRSPCGEGK